MFPIAQEELIPTLTKYGKENPETRIRIKTEYGNIDVQLYRDTPFTGPILSCWSKMAILTIQYFTE